MGSVTSSSVTAERPFPKALEVSNKGVVATIEILLLKVLTLIKEVL